MDTQQENNAVHSQIEISTEKDSTYGNMTRETADPNFVLELFNCHLPCMRNCSVFLKAQF